MRRISSLLLPWAGILLWQWGIRVSMAISRYVRCAFSSLLKSKLLSSLILNDVACGFMQGGPEWNDSI